MTDPVKPVVLIVDDERPIADTLSAILKTQGFDSKAVYSGEAALAELTRCPDFVISDVMMGGMTGIELAIKIRQSHPNCRILLISGAAETAGLLEDAEHQGHGFEILAKPFHPSLLLAWIRSGGRARLYA